MMQKRARAMWLGATFALLVTLGCATLTGAVLGGAIGSMAGDQRMGTAVGATAGAMIDIFGDDYY
jgi:zinc transporter ZupT